jgi:hypothetical protein
LVFTCFHFRSEAQNIKAGVDRNRIFIGEQIKLKLTLEQVRPGLQWFQFPDSLNHFEVLSRGKVDTVASGPLFNYYQEILITSFDSGRWQFPALAISGLNRITLPITIEVLPVDVSKMQDYHDIKDIVEVQAETDPILIAVIAAITLLSIGMIYWLYTRKKSIPVVTKAILKGELSPLDWALAEIDKLSGQSLITSPQIKKYYSDLHHISRSFFEMQFQQRSAQQTTDEWMMILQPLEVDSNIKTPFFQFLRLSDTVKFAKYLPPEYEHTASVESVKQMLQKSALLQSNLYSNYQPQ